MQIKLTEVCIQWGALKTAHLCILYLGNDDLAQNGFSSKCLMRWGILGKCRQMYPADGMEPVILLLAQVRAFLHGQGADRGHRGLGR